MAEPSLRPDDRLNDASIVDYRCPEPSWVEALNASPSRVWVEFSWDQWAPGCPMVSLAWETQVVVRCHKSPSCGMKLDMWKTKRNITSTLWNLPSKIPIHKLKPDQNQERNTEASVKDRTAYIYSPVSPFFTFLEGPNKDHRSEYIWIPVPIAHTSIFTPFSCSEIYLSPPHRPSNHQKDQKGINQWLYIYITILYIIILYIYHICILYK